MYNICIHCEIESNITFELCCYTQSNPKILELFWLQKDKHRVILVSRMHVSRRFNHTTLTTMFFSFISNNLNYLLSDSRLTVFWSNNFYCLNVQSLSSNLSKRKKILEKKHVYFQTFVCHFSSEVFVSSEVTCYEKFPLLMLYLVVSACLLRYPWNATSNACPEIHFFLQFKKRIKVFKKSGHS